MINLRSLENLHSMKTSIRFSRIILFILLPIAALTFLIACSQDSEDSQNKRPNIIFIMADDQRHDMLSVNGNHYVKTPNLNRLAAEGCNFINAFTVSGVCSPSRADFFTGKYAHQCGAPQIIWDNHTFRMNETPFPALLHDEGYYSAHIGKWHLGEGQKQKKGYDYWAGFEWLGNFFNTTVLDLCGVEPPEDMTGKSWRPLLEAGGNKVSDWREDFMFEYWDFRPTLPSQLAVRSDHYKLITYQDFPEKELYDLEKDPRENHNVIHETEYADVAMDMEQRLQKLIEKTGWNQRRFQPVNNSYL